MPIVSANSLLLPRDANLEAAYQTTLILPNPGPNLPVTHKCDGEWYEVVTGGFSQMVTTAVLGTRVAICYYRDADGNLLNEIAAGGGQGPSLAVNYGWQLGLGVASVVLAAVATVPLASILLFPGYDFNFAVQAAGVGDFLQSCSITVLRFPTGFAQATPGPTATPALV